MSRVFFKLSVHDGGNKSTPPPRKERLQSANRAARFFKDRSPTERVYVVSDRDPGPAA